jgi:CubicO group peptidase (beta-lactamase class C family)
MKKVLQPVALFVSSLAALFGCAPSTSSPTSIAELEAYIGQQVKAAKYPGFAIAIVHDKRVVFRQGYGYANLQTRLPATPDTPFMIASVSKVVTGTALMQLVQADGIDLDADINTYLPFEIRNPHSTGKITLRHLATHTSGIVDDTAVLAATYAPGDSSIGFEEFFRSYLVAGGSRYSQKNFAKAAPGTQYHYSNIAVALTAYLLELRTGKDFAQFCQDNIFTPLGMNNTHWFLRQFPDIGKIAFPYDSEHPDLTHYGYPTYPDGQLRSSVNDMAKFLLAAMNGGQVLKPQTLQQMLEPQFTEVNKENPQGLFWVYKNGLIGHAGGDPGALSYLYWNPKTRIGAVMMGNTSLNEKNTSGIANILKTVLRDPEIVKLFE